MRYIAQVLPKTANDICISGINRCRFAKKQLFALIVVITVLAIVLVVTVLAVVLIVVLAVVLAVILVVALIIVLIVVHDSFPPFLVCF